MPSDEQARAAAREILAQPEFARWERGFDGWLALLDGLVARIPAWLIELLTGLQDVVGGLLSWIGAGLGRLLGLFGVFGDVSGTVGWTAVLLLLVATLVLLWRARSLWQRRPRATQTAIRPGRRHADALREARSLAREGRFLEAAHRVHLATLALLIELDWLELARSDPNRTLRRRISVSSLPEREGRQLIALIDRLEALWFAEPRDDPRLFEDWLALDERIVSLAGVRRP